MAPNDLACWRENSETAASQVIGFVTWPYNMQAGQTWANQIAECSDPTTETTTPTPSPSDDTTPDSSSSILSFTLFMFILPLVV